MIARENGTITFTYPSGMPTTKATSISYSVNDTEWVTTSNADETEVTVTVPVVSGDKVRWKGDNVVLADYDGDSEELAFSNFISDCEVDINGNIMSLLYGDDFKGKTTFNAETQAYVFINLFTNYDSFLKVVNAKNLSLPATTLADYCYNAMFQGCTSLTTAPELPATTLAQECYYFMFQGCTSLTTAPELSATTLASGCYAQMFSGCTSLTTAPELSATTLADYCYNYMFNGCTSLTTAPLVLPATTLAEGCYRYMFQGCTSLVNAPELPATTLARRCYHFMFNGCTSLNYIKAMFTTTPSTTYTQNWVSGVSSTGTFVKNSAATWNVSGVNGVPSGWTIETATA